MSPRSRLLPALFATLLVSVIITQAASCALDPYGTEPGEVTQPCVNNANCDDQNPCTIDTCRPDGTCERVAGEDGPLPGQTAGDCKRLDCLGGVFSAANDDADLPDDNEPCTTDTCVTGTPTLTPLMDGATCAMGTTPGSCTAGKCTIECGPGKPPCNDGNPCTQDSCNAIVGTCSFVPLDGLPTPGIPLTAGDCKQQICVNGKDTAVADDVDIPEDANACTQDVCTMGVPSNPPVSLGAPCENNPANGKPEVCDGGGTCVECNDPSDCSNLPVDDDCQKRTCNNHVCGQAFTAAGTSISQQTSGDCKKTVCDGVGGIMIANDDGDLPNDNNPCTGDSCNGGQPAYANLTQGTSCGNPLVCDGIGNCVGCNQPSDCTMLPPNDFCKTRTCVNHQCGLSLTPTGTDLPTGQTAMDCKVVECDDKGNIVTSVDQADVPVDGNQCTKDVCDAQGTPSNPDEAANVVCNQNGGTLCNGVGDCKKGPAQLCAAASECLSTFCVDGVCCNSACSATCKACNVAGNIGTCSNVPAATDDSPSCINANSCDGTGTCKKDNGQTCSAASDCVSGFCADGVCCNAACTTACRSCNLMGSVGACTNIVSMEDNNPAGICAGTKSCDATGACKTNDGQTCSVGSDCLSGFCADGVCCNSACTGTCKACNLTGNVGACSNVALGVDDVGTCSGANQSCDGNGGCKKDNGQTCAAGGDCLSGFCADGVCCNTACTGECQACSTAIRGTGVDGTCGPISAGSDPSNECTNGSCNGAGACKLDNGASCTLATQCLSGSCVDGVCCNSTCTGTCQACDVAGLVGTCSNVPSNSDDVGTCSGTTQSCDGMGGCKKENGQVCSTSADCLGGHCADGVCCDTACTGTCLACNVAGSVGTCSNVAINQDDAGTCSGSTLACNGMGACEADHGEACSLASDCASGHCADGVCCDTACSGTCEACTTALKGTGGNGICGPVAAGTNPPGECLTGVCSGAGMMCIGDIGDMCAASTDCFSGFCADGVCCNSACNTDCSSCNLTGSVGICSFVPAGWDDGACVEATLTKTCDGAGVCLGDTDAACAANGACASGVCDADKNTCQVPATCSNMTKDGSESDEDCGGLCDKCASGKTCNVETDCDPALKCMSGTCQTP